MKYKWMALFLALLLIPSVCLAELVKDETVYVLLNSQGDMDKVLVVNRLEVPEAGEYVDLGSYDDVTALTQDVQASLGDGTVSWTLSAAPEGFAYVGALTEVTLPLQVSIAYTLDGEAMLPEAMVGLAGRVALTLALTPNADSNLSTDLMAQVQVPLSRLHCADIDAPGASSVLIGDVQTLSYTLLPGQEASYTLQFSTESFQMDSISIASMPISLEDMLGIDLAEVSTQTDALKDGSASLRDGAIELQSGVATLADGLAQLGEGAAALPEGTQALAEGITGLTDGLSQLSTASAALSENAPALGQGLSDYVAGVDALVQGNTAMAEGFAELSAASTMLYQQYTALAQGVEQTLQAVTPTLAALPEAQQTALTAQLSLLSEQLNAYAAALLAYSEQTGLAVAGLQSAAQQAAPLTQSGAQLSGGVTATMDGLVQLSAGLSTVAAQVPELGNGMAALSEGQLALVAALTEINTAMGAFPEQLDAFVSGQTQLADGIAQAVDMLTEYSSIGLSSDAQLTSFTGDQSVRSLQFVYQTAALSPVVEKAAIEETAEPTGFFERLKALFVTK